MTRSARALGCDAPTCSTFEASDFEEMEAAWKADGWQADYRQIRGGGFRGRLLKLDGGGPTLIRGTWDGAIRHRGLQPPGTVSLVVTLHQEGDSSFDGGPISPQAAIVQTNEVGFEIAGARYWDAAIFQLPETDFAADVAALSRRHPRELTGCRGVMPLPPASAARLRARCLAHLAAAEHAAAPPGTGSGTTAALQDLVSEVVSVVSSRLTRLDAPPLPSSRRKLVRNAEDYALAASSEPVRMPDLCRALGVSERTLRYAFRDVTGESAAAYLKALRLNRVHRTLRAADPKGVLVKEVALSNGFRQLGEFARSYETLFGELPSQTLARPSRSARF